MFFFSLFSLNGSSKRIEYSPLSIPGIYTLSRSELTELYENRVKLSAYDLYPPYIQLRILWNIDHPSQQLHIYSPLSSPYRWDRASLYAEQKMGDALQWELAELAAGRICLDGLVQLRITREFELGANRVAINPPTCFVLNLDKPKEVES